MNLLDRMLSANGVKPYRNALAQVLWKCRWGIHPSGTEGASPYVVRVKSSSESRARRSLAPPSGAKFLQDWEHLAQKCRYRRKRLAELLQVSVRTLERHFEKHFSSTLGEWLNELRLAKAYDQVVSGKALKEISYDSGFKQPSHFTKCFKKRFGVPPSLLLGRGAAPCGSQLSFVW